MGLQQPAHEHLGLLLEQAGGDTLCVDGHHAALGHVDLPDPGGSHGGGVHGGEVARRVAERHRVVAAHRVELVAGRVPALGQLVVVVAAAEDPRPGRDLGRTSCDGGDDVADGADDRVLEGQHGEAGPEALHVVVGVVEPGDDRRPGQVDPPTGVMGGELTGTGDRHDAVSQDPDAARARPGRVTRDHRGVVEDQVEAHRSSVSHRQERVRGGCDEHGRR